MNTRISRILALVFAIAFMTVITAESKAQEGAWEIGPRKLPASGGVSDIIHEALVSTTLADVDMMKGMAPKTAEEWEAWVQERDASSAEGAQALARALSVKVEDDMMGGVAIHRVSPAEIDDRHKNHLFVYIHGGAWVLNGGLAGTAEAVLIAARLRMPVISIDYRMPPGHPAPAAIDDIVAVWKELLKEHSPASMAMGGSSAGGNITLASVHRFRDLQLAFPGALYMGTPCVDIDFIGDSRFINEGIDRHLLAWEGIPLEAGIMYAGDYDLKHPYISPIYGDFKSFPPTYLISGTRDLLLSDAIRAHRELRRAGVEADLHIYEGQSHGDYAIIANAPESAEHYAELNAFLLKHLPGPLVLDSIHATETLKEFEVPKSSLY
jgi:acetyl esterase/lipase